MATMMATTMTASSALPFPTTVALTTTTTTTTNVVCFPRRGGAIKIMNRLAASTARPPTVRCCALSPGLRSSLDKVVGSSKVVLFMKGTKDFPQCGFSNTVVQILKSLNVPFDTIDILENDILRQGLKLYSSWPTFPQLYIDGDFFGGCDITVAAYQSGELQEVLEKAMCS